MSERRPDFADLVATMARLRAPGGCPWDRAQTPASLRPYLLEEAYETLEAIDGGVPARLKEELGDLLLQVVFHSEMAEETGAFTIDDVVAGLVEKLIRRHPHVFGTATAATPDAVVTRWEAIKQAERLNHGGAGGDPAGAADAAPESGVLADLARTLPALMLAQQMLVRAGRAGFTVPGGAGPEGARAALHRALDEIARVPQSGEAAAEAAGDLLFAAAAAARALDVDAELALRAACDRYRARFARMEALARARGASLADCAPDVLAALWREARAPR
ncbi:MAG TPA: nucleoside triphosphate pyrophosphohydrolase [bacterium]|nr:nucleoside triphosphate pyrophosphohydrolase [bacterium]